MCEYNNNLLAKVHRLRFVSAMRSKSFFHSSNSLDTTTHASATTPRCTAAMCYLSSKQCIGAMM